MRDMRGIIVRVLPVAVLLAVVAAAVWAVIDRPSMWPLLRAYRWWVLTVIVTTVVLLLGGLLFTVLLRSPLRSSWRSHVRAEAKAISHQVSSLPVPAGEPEHTRTVGICEAIRDHLRVAVKAAHPPVKQRSGEHFRDYWTGASIEAAYLNLHAAETALARLLPPEEIEARIPEALARLQTMDVTDPRRRAAERKLAPNGTLWPGRRAAFQNAVRIGFELMDRQHARVRSFRNIVLTAALGLMLLVVAICLVGAHAPDAFPLCFGPTPTSAPVQGPAGVACPSEESPPSPGTQPRRLPAAGDVTMVALMGLLGGALSAAVALRKLQGSSIPYGVPVALSLLKLPSGALSAIVGLLLVRGEFIPGLSQLDNQPQILGYAFIFGIAQHVVTRLVDRQAQDIMTKVPSKEPMSDKPGPSLDE
jgi:hypothetical protein